MRRRGLLIAYDKRVSAVLVTMGWKVVVVWECEVASAAKAQTTGVRLARLIREQHEG